ncbi:hypothetical protein AHP1_1701 [Aeromonas phage Ahp1_CNU-2021]|nr:hypothetical protein AHP1_1701 [Aeromonas phage Ahp1_CNU-2021]
MADLKLGTQIGGNLVWHQGILDLNPVDTKLYFQDQEVLVDTGYQTLKGTMKFNVPANQYDIESISVLPAGSKSMLRKFRGGNNDTIWHETVQNTKYRISTGNTDAGLILELAHGASAIFQNSVLTNAAQSTAANSFVRKDYVDAIDAKNVAKAGDTMTGDLLFDSASRKVRVNEVASVTAGWDAAGNSTFFRMGPYDQAKGGDLLEIRSAGAGVGNRTSGFDVRTTKNISNTPLYVGDHMVYHPANKPTPNDLGAYNKAEIDTKSWLRVKDERATMIQPSALDPKTMGLYFTNQSDVTSSWVSGFTVKGWEGNYAAWSLFSAARSDADDKRLWFKHGRADWMASTRIYHEDDKPTNDELNLVSRAGDEMTGPLTIRNSTFQCVTGWGVRRIMKQLGPQNDAKPVLVLFCPKYIGAALPKSGFVGRVTFDRGATTSTLQANYVDLSAVTGYTATDAQIHYASGGTPVKLVYTTHNGVEYLAMYRAAVSAATLVIDGYCYGADPILISDATSYTVTDVEVRERIYSSDNKPTNVDLNLVSRAGDTMTGSLNGPDFIQTTPQSSNGAASARKDYVDAQDAKTVAKAGDTMTGVLIATQFKASTDYGFVRSTNNAQGMFVGADGRTILGGGTGVLSIRPQGIGTPAGESVFNNDGTIAIYKTGTADNHLVTKKYVDDKVGTAVQSVTATGAVKSTGGINPVISLDNATNQTDGAMSFADKAKLDGIPAAAVNRTGDTMTGRLTVPSIIDNATNLGKDALAYVTVPANQWAGPLGQARMVKPDSVGGPAGMKGGYWNILGRRDSAGGYAGIYIPYGDTDNKNYIGTNQTGTNAPIWAEIYTNLNKPTNVDLNLVSRAGDTMTGTLNAPDFIQTTAQSTSAAACTRKDYVDNLVTTLRNDVYSKSTSDARYVIKTGDTMSGNLTVPKVLLSAAQGTEANSAARKDYVDAVDAKNVAKTGDTMTGNLVVKTDIFVKDNVNVTGHQITFGDKAAGKTSGETGITTARFIELLTAMGAFKTVDWVGNVTWNYAANNVLTDTGYGNIHLAGCTVEVNGIAEYTIRLTTPTMSGTSMPGAQNNTQSEFIYNNQGASYQPKWRRQINDTMVVDNGNSWAGVVGKVPFIGSNGVMEVAKYIDFHDTNSTEDFTTRLAVGGSKQLQIFSTNGSVDIGAQNSSYAHIYTDRPKFAFNKPITQLNDGYLTINNSSPTVLLQDLDNHSSFLHTNSGIFYILRSAGANGDTFDAGPNGIHPMTMNLANGDVQFSRNGSFNDVQIRSDRRLKSNFLPIVSAVEKVGMLSGFTFDKIGCDKREAGIIAQDLQKVLPESVGTFKNTAGNEYLTVSNSGVNALLVEAIKELTDRVKYLESKLN